jgi:hypothetical protein
VPLGKEDCMLIQVMDWVKHHHFDKFIFHVANERFTTPHSGALLKRKGVLAGVSDILILKPSNGYNGAAIELKMPLGRLTKPQKTFLETAHDNGYFVGVCYSAESAIKAIKDYLMIDHHK